jgi:hypothetical protein
MKPPEFGQAEKLEDRRKSRKLNLFYKIENNMAPTYVSDCLPYFSFRKNVYSFGRPLACVVNMITPFTVTRKTNT